MAGRDQGSDGFSSHCSSDVAGSEKVEHLHRDFSLHAHGQGCEVHHAQLLLNRILK